MSISKRKANKQNKSKHKYVDLTKRVKMKMMENKMQIKFQGVLK